ncbi:MAG: hypothetical protein EBZ48_09535 [Proteobacteria bacterium]|nr:hypothetical protein [Pseudomonadota bacterium]
MGIRFGSNEGRTPSQVEQIDSKMPHAERMEALIKLALTAPELADRNEASRALRPFGREGVAKLEPYTRVSPSAMEGQRSRAVEALRLIAPEVDDAYRVLTEVAMKDPSQAVRRSAALSISSNKAALDSLKEALANPESEEQIRLNILEALGRFYEFGVPMLHRVVTQDPSEAVRLRAVEVLAEMARFCDDPLPALRAAQRDPASTVCDRANRVLAMILNRRSGTPSED